MSYVLAPQVWAAALSTVEQEYLSQARQMRAPSFAVHIPLVCFASLPEHGAAREVAMRSGTCDGAYRALARARSVADRRSALPCGPGDTSCCRCS